MIKIDNISKKYCDPTSKEIFINVLKDISLDISKGEVVAVIGKSGAGKTTLLKCINMLIIPDKGKIYFNDTFINSTNATKIRQKIGIVFQSYGLFEHLTVIENITIAPIKILGRNKFETQNNGEELLKKVGLVDKMNAFPDELSGGEKQRIAIARVLAMEPSVILLDEPTSALDPIMTNEILQIICDLARNGMTMLIATHDLDFVRIIADRIVFIDNGEITEVGDSNQIFNNPTNIKTKEFVESKQKYLKIIEY